MGMSFAALIGLKHRAQARVTRACYRQLALPSCTGRECFSGECPRETIGQIGCSEIREKRAPAKPGVCITFFVVIWTELTELFRQ